MYKRQASSVYLYMYGRNWSIQKLYRRWVYWDGNTNNIINPYSTATNNIGQMDNGQEYRYQ